MRRVHRIPRRWVPIVPSPSHVSIYMRTHTHLYVLFCIKYICIYRYKWVARFIAYRGFRLPAILFRVYASPGQGHSWFMLWSGPAWLRRRALTRYIGRQSMPFEWRPTVKTATKSMSFGFFLRFLWMRCDGSVMTDDYGRCAWEMLVQLFLSRHVTFFLVVILSGPLSDFSVP